MSRAKFPGHPHFQNFPETGGRYPLIGPGDPPPYMTYNDHGPASLLLVADHASPFFPAAMNQLGLADWVLDRHVAWDIGSDQLTRFLADELNAQAVLAGFSRLIVDPNRKLDDPTAFVEVSDGIGIPGNMDLDEEQKSLRVQSFFQPYHDAIDHQFNLVLLSSHIKTASGLDVFEPHFRRKLGAFTHLGDIAGDLGVDADLDSVGCDRCDSGYHTA